LTCRPNDTNQMKEFNDITLQKIEDYVMDRLDPTERTLFETELATNAELREEVDKTVMVKETAERSKFRTKIKAIQTEKLTEWNTEVLEHVDHQEVEKTGNARKVNWLGRSTTFAAAASVLFVAYLALSPVSLPDAYTVTVRGESVTDSLQTAVYSRYSEAIAALENEDFDTAAVLFDSVATKDNIRPYYKEAAIWYGGVARIKSEPETAKQLTQYVINKENKEFKISRLNQVKVWIKIKVSELF